MRVAADYLERNHNPHSPCFVNIRPTKKLSLEFTGFNIASKQLNYGLKAGSPTEDGDYRLSLATSWEEVPEMMLQSTSS